MTDQEIHDTVTQVFRKVLENDAIVLKPEDTGDDVEGWLKLIRAYSVMSQPDKAASAPRLAAPRRKKRRDGSGKSLAASLIRSFGSTPGTCLRMRGTAFSSR